MNFLSIHIWQSLLIGLSTACLRSSVGACYLTSVVAV